jgi:hypothetical protein
MDLDVSLDRVCGLCRDVPAPGVLIGLEVKADVLTDIHQGCKCECLFVCIL